MYGVLLNYLVRKLTAVNPEFKVVGAN